MWANTNISTRKNNHTGFTIVELLIVIVVIGILAVITIVAYNGIQQRARSSSAISALGQAGKKLSLYQVDNGTYPATGNLLAAGVSDSQDITFQYTSSGTSFCLTATNGNVSYKTTEGSSPTAGGCPGHGQGGVAAMTNLHVNPGATSTTGYGAWNGGGLNTTTLTSVASAWSLSGTVVRATWTNVDTVNGDLQYYLNTSNALVAGQTYTIRYRLAAGQNCNMSPPAVYSSAGITTTIARSHTSDSTMTAGSPIEYWVTFQADATALTSGLRVIHNPRSKVAGYYYDLSETVIYQGSRDPSIGFKWGNSPNWVWTGTANNSTSMGPPQ